MAILAVNYIVTGPSHVGSPIAPAPGCGGDRHRLRHPRQVHRRPASCGGDGCGGCPDRCLAARSDLVATTRVDSRSFARSAGARNALRAPASAHRSFAGALRSIGHSEQRAGWRSIRGRRPTGGPSSRPSLASASVAPPDSVKASRARSPNTIEARPRGPNQPTKATVWSARRLPTIDIATGTMRMTVRLRIA